MNIHRHSKDEEIDTGVFLGAVLAGMGMVFPLLCRLVPGLLLTSAAAVAVAGVIYFFRPRGSHAARSR